MFLSVEGNHFIANQKPIQLRGTGLGNWLNLEHFLIGIPGTDSEIRHAVAVAFGAERAGQFWRSYYLNFVSDKDLRFFAELGFNSIRLPVNARTFFDADSFEESTAARELDRIISLCASHKIYAIIDLHATMAGQNPDWHSDNNTGDCGFFKDKKIQKETAHLWRDIALRYKDNPWVGGYDLINEPCYFEKSFDAILVRFYADCIEQIRSVDNRHIIFLEGNTYARDFSMFQSNMDDNLAYTFHYYPFLQLPNQLDEPGLKERIKNSLYADVTLSHLQDRLCRPLWCGETGHPLHDPTHIGGLKVYLELLEEMNISWSLWPAKDARAMALCYPPQTSTYLSLVKQATAAWRFWDIFNQDSILSVEGSTDKHQFYRSLAKNSTDANFRFQEALKQISFETLLESLDDFKFENCEHNNPLISCFTESKQ